MTAQTQANTPGHILTASAQNITGGTAPAEYEYKWLVDGLTMGTNKTINIVSSFVGKIVSCEVTVAEPDGSDGSVTKTAVYNKVIEVAGTIDTPEVLAPADGAGSGDARYLISDTISDVEGGGVITCETDTIESVSTNSYSVAGGGNARANIGNMFDGDTSTNGECDIGTTNILFDEPISGVTKIEYNTSWNNNQSGRFSCK